MIRPASLALALTATAFWLAATPGEAAGRKAGHPVRHAEKRAVPALPAKSPVAAPDGSTSPEHAKPAGVWTSGEQERACFRGRRKLWQDGQGWVVKRVSVCP